MIQGFSHRQDEHLLTVLRYVERNPLRANLVRRAENWRWSSLAGRQQGKEGSPGPAWLDAGPCRLPKNWSEQVNEALTPAEVERLRQSVNRGTPYGAAWVANTAKQLETSLRPRGRPRKVKK